jgi:hypothetical protein
VLTAQRRQRPAFALAHQVLALPNSPPPARSSPGIGRNSNY